MRTSEFECLATTKEPAVQPVRAPEDEIFVPYSALAAHGIPYTRVHLRRLIQRELFPRPRMLSANRLAWLLSDIIQWKASRPMAPMPAADDTA